MFFQARECDRAFTRLKLLVRGRYAAIEGDADLSKVFAGGAVHKHPEYEFELHSGVLGSTKCGAPGFRGGGGGGASWGGFKGMYAPLAELEAMHARAKQWNEEALRRLGGGGGGGSGGGGGGGGEGAGGGGS